VLKDVGVIFKVVTLMEKLEKWMQEYCKIILIELILTFAFQVPDGKA